ncbi:GntR family transcriptional regulator [Agromyces atrinae]|uniref:GntR family transcriptional regulator n=1 Tax=Agromyces atrinae TaxID=592376 RepID=UPI001F569A6E|nr:GntR family transcriptional regulator [Agromyces atrinae]MCI2957378.1 GntR family transcriptional regulator [Agromyces atrinae]
MPITTATDIDRRGLRDRVYESILGMLVDGAVEPGERLSIDTVAKALDVSPTPVREALVMLERTGLVTRVALKGYRVAPQPDAAQLEELFEARLMLEVEAVRLAFPHRVSLRPRLAELMSAHRAAAAAVRSHVGAEVPVELTQRYFQSDSDVHRVIVEHSGNRYLRDMYDSLGALTHRMRQAGTRGPSDAAQALDEHRAIALAFEGDEVDAAVAAMRAHIENVRGRAIADAS